MCCPALLRPECRRSPGQEGSSEAAHCGRCLHSGVSAGSALRRRYRRLARHDGRALHRYSRLRTVDHEGQPSYRPARRIGDSRPARSCAARGRRHRCSCRPWQHSAPGLGGRRATRWRGRVAVGRRRHAGEGNRGGSLRRSVASAQNSDGRESGSVWQPTQDSRTPRRQRSQRGDGRARRRLERRCRLAHEGQSLPLGRAAPTICRRGGRLAPGMPAPRRLANCSAGTGRLKW